MDLSCLQPAQLRVNNAYIRYILPQPPCLVRPLPMKDLKPQRPNDTCDADDLGGTMKFSEQIKLAKSTKQIHSAWYRETYPEVAELGMDPAMHYLRYGAAMGRNPGKNFDTQFYLETYPEAAESGLNPLIHYALHGQAAGLATRSRHHDPRKRINIIRTKLLSLGFTERPLQELTDIANAAGEDPEARAMAARELALWHMRAKTYDDYRIALDWIAKAREHGPDLEFRAKLSTVELLCHYHLGATDAGLAAYDRAALAGEATPDLKLARVNFETTPERRVAWINQVLARYGIEPVTLLPEEGQPAYDRLTCAVPLPKVTEGPKVTVLIAAYDAAEMLPTALRSLQEQTWANLEIIVLDDCSPTPDTLRVAEEFAATDPRIQVVRMAENGGAYVARNHGLDMATGEFVTLHDADDWSHPRKIETQVRFMMENPEVMGCTSRQARITEDYEFSVVRKNGAFLIPNISSYCFRRSNVKTAIGYWDSVRFGADAQYIKRMQVHFGDDAYVAIDTAPLSFQRAAEESATGNKSFGFDGFKYGVRKVYEDFEKHWMATSKSMWLSSNENKRSFFSPEPMRKNRTQIKRHFDVIIASDFRFPGGTTSSNAEEIKAQKAAGLKTGLVELYSYGFGPQRPMNEKIMSLIDGDSVDLICFGEEVSCDVLILRQPMTFTWVQRYVPKVTTKRAHIILNQPPKRDYSETGETVFSIPDCVNSVKEMFGITPTWHPIGPLVRNAVLVHHQEDLKHIQLSETDWPNIIDLQAWKRPARPELSGRKFRVCRHSRDGYVKWPKDATTIKQVYPDCPELEINILGGASVPAEVLGGKLPDNWNVQEFGTVEPAEFLAEQDVFVYFTHPDWVEAFGRAIFEPMSVGVPVILPKGLGYEALFEDAALYCDPDEVRATIRRLMDDPIAYNKQVEVAFQIVRRKFSYENHISRVSL